MAAKHASTNISAGRHENSAKGERTRVTKFTIVFYYSLQCKGRHFSCDFVLTVLFLDCSASTCVACFSIVVKKSQKLVGDRPMFEICLRNLIHWS